MPLEVCIRVAQCFSVLFCTEFDYMQYMDVSYKNSMLNSTKETLKMKEVDDHDLSLF